MKKSEIILLIGVLIFTFFLVYAIHWNYSFPYHVDEWKQITESVNLKTGDYGSNEIGIEKGFHIFLSFLSLFVNLILFYKFLPAIWAVLSALTLFYVVYRKTNNNFWIALLSIIFFASVKSNSNLTGIWFFTPLSFSIPFIFLYIYFFTEGIEKQNKKLILYSLAIMAFLIPIHALSVLFAIPLLLIYSLFHFNYLKKEFKFFSLFLIIPIIGILFYKYVNSLTFLQTIKILFNALQFKYGWGVAEFRNSLTELYSPIGLILAFLGISVLLFKKEYTKKYLIYILWPIILLISIASYKIFEVSFLSPYQRNLYYFVISLPFLSAFGIYFSLIFLKKLFKRENTWKIVSALAIIIILFFTFYQHYNLPKQSSLYQLIDEQDYKDILFLSTLSKGIVLATPEISSTIYPISKQKPLAALLFYGNRDIADKFFKTQDCAQKNKTIENNNVSYVMSYEELNCGWNQIYKGKNYIYKIQ